MTVDIYTDGSCLGNPGFGGWAAICSEFTICGCNEDGPKTTNNIMELTAAIRALEKAHECGMASVRVFTDSTYVKKGITEWVSGWERKNWVTSSRTEVKNKQLWIELLRLTRLFSAGAIEWQWVKAHNGNPMNEKVDKLARDCAEYNKKKS